MEQRESRATAVVGRGIFRDERMKTDIGIWNIDQKCRAGRKLDVTNRLETEEMLEEVLVKNPDMLCADSR